MDNGSLAVLKPNDVKAGFNTTAGVKCYPAFYGKSQILSSHSVNQNRDESRKLLKCGICSEVFISTYDISNHLLHQHQTVQVFDCGICLKFYPIHHELETHLLEEHMQNDSGPSPILMQSSNIDVAEIENFVKNSEFREKVELECPFCKCVYHKLALYQQHMSASHRGKAWDKDGLCNAILKVTTVKSSSVKPVIRDDPKEIVPGKVYTCGHCNKKVFGKESMKRHIASHRDGTIIQCALCCDFFVSNASFTAHRKSAHPSLNNLNLKQNEHGDIIGSSLEDVLKANDCLSTLPCIDKDKSTARKNDPAQTQVNSFPTSDKQKNVPALFHLDTDCVITHKFTTIDCKTKNYGEKLAKTIAAAKEATAKAKAKSQGSKKNRKQVNARKRGRPPKAIINPSSTEILQNKRIATEADQRDISSVITSTLTEIHQSKDVFTTPEKRDVSSVSASNSTELLQSKRIATEADKRDILSVNACTLTEIHQSKDVFTTPEKRDVSSVSSRNSTEVLQSKRIATESEKRDVSSVSASTSKEIDPSKNVSTTSDMPSVSLCSFTTIPQIKHVATNVDVSSVCPPSFTDIPQLQFVAAVTDKSKEVVPPPTKIIDRLATELDKLETLSKDTQSQKHPSATVYSVKESCKKPPGDIKQCEKEPIEIKKEDICGKENKSNGELIHSIENNECYRASWYLGVRYILTALASMAAFRQYYTNVGKSGGNNK